MKEMGTRTRQKERGERERRSGREGEVREIFYIFVEWYAPYVYVYGYEQPVDHAAVTCDLAK